MSEKHQQRAREIAIQVRDQCGSPAGGILERTVRRTIAAALEAVERECQAENARLRRRLEEECGIALHATGCMDRGCRVCNTAMKRYIAEADAARAGKGQDAAQAQH